jgi:hypothetical protein
MKLTELQMIHILENNLVNDCTEDQKNQVYEFAFGIEYLRSKNKGALVTSTKNQR